MKGMRDIFRGLTKKNAPVENNEDYNMDYYAMSIREAADTTAKSEPEETAPEVQPEAVAEPEIKEPDIIYVSPETIADAADIVDGLLDRCVVYVDISGVEDGQLIRIFDYMMGASRALGCVMKPKNGDTLVAVPSGVDINEYLDECPVDGDGYESEYEDDDSQE